MKRKGTSRKPTNKSKYLYMMPLKIQNICNSKRIYSKRMLSRRSGVEWGSIVHMFGRCKHRELGILVRSAAFLQWSPEVIVDLLAYNDKAAILALKQRAKQIGLHLKDVPAFKYWLRREIKLRIIRVYRDALCIPLDMSLSDVGEVFLKENDLLEVSQLSNLMGRDF